MGFLNNLLRRQPKADETRNLYGGSLYDGPSWYSGLGSPVVASNVNVRLAENLACVSACVYAVSSAIGSLPAFVYRADEAGKIEQPAHPIARLISGGPNADQSWCDWIEWMLAQVLLYGNAISIIGIDGRGAVTSLRPAPWPLVAVSRLPSGRIAYDITPVTGGPATRYFADQLLHLRDRSDDGIIGRSRISRSPDVLGNALALQEFSKRAWQNGATPSGAFEFPGNLSPENFARIRSHVQDSYEGSHNAKRVMILDGGAKWTAMSLSMEDAETLASRKFSVEELCRLYNVPPPLVQSYDHNTFTNAQQADLWFASRTLLPWCRKIESEFQRSIFGSASPFSLELDLSGLTRGDPATRWAAYAIARTNNILTIDEIREAEGYGPLAAVAPNRAAIAE